MIRHADDDRVKLDYPLTANETRDAQGVYTRENSSIL
jgi:hypothetical protein